MNRQRILSIIGQALRRHSLRTVFSAAVLAASVMLEVLPPLILARAVDALTRNAAVSFTLGAGYFLLLAASGLTNALREALIVINGESLTHALRSAMEKKLQHLPARYFTSHEAGQIASLQVNDVDAIEELFSSGLVSLFTDAGTVCAILAVIFTRSIGLGILLLMVLPLLFAFTRLVQRRMLDAHTRNRQAAAQASGLLPETLHIIRSLHVYHAENFAVNRYDGAVQRSFAAMEKTNFYDAVYSPVIMTASAAVTGLMLSLSGQSGIFRSWFGMSVGTAVAVISYVGQIFTPLSNIGMEIQTVQAAAAGWKRVQQFLDEPERPEVPLLPVSRETPDAIAVSHVTFSYDGIHPVLQDFSLTVKRGEFVTLTGRTGIGKSTLFKLLLGLYEPQRGSIRISGIAPGALGDAQKRKVLCCVEQKLIPVPGSIRAQVSLGNPNFSDEEIWRALETAGLAAAVKSLPRQLDEPYQNSLFSQGQKQLLMIARAIVSDPEILLLDEITAGLDSATEKMVVTALEKASQNRTVLSISHRLTDPRNTITLK